MSHLEVPGNEVQLLIRTQLICHGAGPPDLEDRSDGIVMNKWLQVRFILLFWSIYKMLNVLNHFQFNIGLQLKIHFTVNESVKSVYKMSEKGEKY